MSHECKTLEVTTRHTFVFDISAKFHELHAEYEPDDLKSVAWSKILCILTLFCSVLKDGALPWLRME